MLCLLSKALRERAAFPDDGGGSRGERPRNCSWKDQSISRGGEGSRTKEPPPTALTSRWPERGAHPLTKQSPAKE